MLKIWPESVKPPASGSETVLHSSHSSVCFNSRDAG